MACRLGFGRYYLLFDMASFQPWDILLQHYNRKKMAMPVVLFGRAIQSSYVL